MNSLTEYQPLGTLYPLGRDFSVLAIVQATLAWEKSREGKPLLHRELTTAERTLLQDRFRLLTDNLQAAKRGDIIARVSQMIMGFGAAAANIGKKDATTIAVQYAVVLQSLPMWAIERAIGKFERGEVSADQVEGVNRAFWPTTAQLHVIASELAAEFFAERRQLRDALHGVVERQISDEERQRVADGLAELADSMKAGFAPPARDEPLLDQEYIDRIAVDLRRAYPPRETKGKAGQKKRVAA